MQLGQKIKELRMMYGLTQEELADRAELSKGFISQLERDLTSPSIATLVDVLSCLGTDLAHFFSDLEPEQVVFKPDDMFTKIDEDAKSTTCWLVPNAQKNRMEPILLTLQPGGHSYEDDPHEGEEFGYVLSGSVLLTVGGAKHKLKKGDSFYFSPTRPHSLVNRGKSDSKDRMGYRPAEFLIQQRGDGRHGGTTD